MTDTQCIVIKIDDEEGVKHTHIITYDSRTWLLAVGEVWSMTKNEVDLPIDVAKLVIREITPNSGEQSFLL